MKRMVLHFLRRSKSKADGETLPLAEAALRALEIARLERLPLEYISDRSGKDRAQHWFANNIFRAGIARGRASPTAESETLTPDKIRGLELDVDMNAVRESGAAEPKYVDLVLTNKELKGYLEWVRTVQ